MTASRHLITTWVPSSDAKATTFARVSCKRYQHEGHVGVPFKILEMVTPAIEGDRIFFPTVTGEVLALNVDNLAFLWAVKFCECSNEAAAWSVAADKGMVLMAGMSDAQQMVNNCLYALAAESGETRWTFKITPLIMMFPIIAGDRVAFMNPSGGVTCLKLKDGSELWTTPGERASNSWGGAAPGPGDMLYAASNRKAKRAWNFPFGGKGVVRAHSLKDGVLKWERLFDLEANTMPSFLRNGPGGKPAVVLGLGSVPGVPPGSNIPYSKPTGDEWSGLFVALDASTGETLWQFAPPVWRDATVCANNKEQPVQVRPWTNASVGADGTVYVGWNFSGTLYALDGATGKEVSSYCLGSSFNSMPVLGPGLLAISGWENHTSTSLWSMEQAVPGMVLKGLAAPMAASGVEHFWPCKACDPRHLGISKYRAPRDLSRPSWTYRIQNWTPTDWFGNSPVIDAQMNTYLSGNWSDLYIIRPDGKLRGTITVDNGAVPTVCLDGSRLFAVDCGGFAMAYDVASLELLWRVRYCVCRMMDNWALTVVDGLLLLCGCEARSVEHEPWHDGERFVYALDVATGATRWSFEIPTRDKTGAVPVLWNFTPAIFEDLMVIMDYHLGVYCHRLADGSKLWEYIGEGCWSTGNQTAAPNGLAYTTGNRLLNPKDPEDKREEGVVRAWDFRTGAMKWERTIPELNVQQGPIAVPAPAEQGGGGGYVLVVPFGNYPGWHGEEACRAAVVALDGSTGDEVWRRDMPLLYGEQAGQEKAIAPDTYGGMACGADGVLYCVYQNGVVYALVGATGEYLSEFDTRSANNAQIAIAPGMLLVASGHDLVVWRDKDLEDDWRAGAADDPRAVVPWAPAEVPPPWPDVDADKYLFTPKSLAPMEQIIPVQVGEEVREDHLAAVRTVHNKELKQLASEGIVSAAGRAVLGGFGWMAAAQEADAQLYKDRCDEKWSDWLQRNEEASRARATAAGQPRSAGGLRWRVLGGGKAGGIVVRKGKDIKSSELPTRLATGSEVQELELVGERLHFKLLDGEGPDSGWVSLSFKGSPLLAKVQGDGAGA